MIAALMVFCATFALDFVWTKYIAEVGHKAAHKAAMWSMLMIPLTAINVTGYTTHWWLVFPAMAGAYLSTWWAVWRENKPAELPPDVRDDYVDLFAAARMHWSKDPAVPYMNCSCKICTAARVQEAHDLLGKPTKLKETHSERCRCGLCMESRA